MLSRTRSCVASFKAFGGTEHWTVRNRRGRSDCYNQHANLFLQLPSQHIWTIHSIYRVAPKIWHNFLYALTLSNINRFSQVFYYQHQKKICNNTIIKNPITPQVCHYCLLYTSPSPRDRTRSRMPSSA